MESFFAFFFLRRPAYMADLLKILVVAATLYFLWFYIHFALLPNSGARCAHARPLPPPIAAHAPPRPPPSPPAHPRTPPTHGTRAAQATATPSCAWSSSARW